MAYYLLSRHGDESFNKFLESRSRSGSSQEDLATGIILLTYKKIKSIGALVFELKARTSRQTDPNPLVSSQFGAFQFGAIHFGAFPIFVSMLIQYSRQFSLFSAKASLARVAYLFVRVFPFCACFLRRSVVYEEVLSTPVCHEANLLGLLWRAYHFLRIFHSFKCVVLSASYIY